jgi:hypothetical protein
MHRQTIKRMITILGIPAGLVAAAAVPTVAAATHATPALRGDVPAVPLWRPPLPCVARSAVSGFGAGFCPGTEAIDWRQVTRAEHKPTEETIVIPSIISDGTRQPITVELITPTDPSTDAATIGFDLTLAGELAEQLANADPPRLVIWVTMATPAPAQPPAPKPAVAGCPVTPGTGDDIVPGTRRMPLC